MRMVPDASKIATSAPCQEKVHPMDKAELLTEFRSRVEEFERYQSFITKAQSQSSRFAPAVVEKVVKDNTEKSLVVIGQSRDLIKDVRAAMAKLDSSRQSVLDGRGNSQFALEELELRLAIGEMTEEEFEQAASDLKSSLGSIDQTADAVDQELASYQDLMNRWDGLLAQSGIAPEPLVQEETPVQRSQTRHEDDLVLLSGDGDVAVFDEEPEPLVSLGDEIGDGPVVINAMPEEIDILNEDEPSPDTEPPAPRVGGDENRRAVLLYQEGTAEEQIYPFVNDQITLGRGRDNDIQVKNDSKVSRYHCKLYRRGPNYYIEDNKSANGTLVNGELITERRLFGGEEVIIGETFFRFRILD